MVAASVGAPRDPKMDFKELIEMIMKNTAAQEEQTKKMEEQTKKWRKEWGLPDLEPTELDLLLQKWEQARDAPLTPAPEPRGEELSLPGAAASGAQRGGAAASGAQRGGAAASGAQRGGAVASGAQRGGGEKHTSTTAPTTTPTVQFGAAASSPSTFAPGHPAGLPRPPCAGPGAQESAALATALPLVPCSTLPEHPDVAGLLPDVAVAPPVRCFAPPG
ncbi:UNVERIFIED_CONTAM: hypothetical protein FKN15_046810 [Acipenser sinensis]